MQVHTGGSPTGAFFRRLTLPTALANARKELRRVLGRGRRMSGSRDPHCRTGPATGGVRRRRGACARRRRLRPLGEMFGEHLAQQFEGVVGSSSCVGCLAPLGSGHRGLVFDFCSASGSVPHCCEGDGVRDVRGSAPVGANSNAKDQQAHCRQPPSARRAPAMC